MAAMSQFAVVPKTVPVEGSNKNIRLAKESALSFPFSFKGRGKRGLTIDIE